MSDYPKTCFCGCGEPRQKFDETNLDGWLTLMELAPWLNYLRVMKGAGSTDEALAKTEAFTDDGRAIFIRLSEEAHGGPRRKRKERKLTKRWRDFSKESREGASAFALDQGMPDPFDMEPPPQDMFLRWVKDGVVPPVEVEDE